MKHFFLFLILLLSPLLAHAGNFSCTGKVATLAFHPLNGILQVDTGYGVHYLCMIQAEYNGVHPEICKAWYSMLLTAKVAGKDIQQAYSQSPTGAQNCAELGSWVIPNPFPYHVKILD